MPANAATAPMVPPTIAPVCLAPPPPPLAVVGAERLVGVLVDDEELLVNVGPAVFVGEGMLIVVRIPDAFVLEDELGDDLVEPELVVPESL